MEKSGTQRKFLAVLATLILISSAAIVWPDPFTGPAATGVEPSDSSPGETLRAGARPGPDQLDGQIEGGITTDGREALAAPPALLVRGRCVAFGTGAEIPDATWIWSLEDRDGDPVVGRAGRQTSGRFELALRRPGGSLELRLEAPGRVPLRCRVPLRPADHAEAVSVPPILDLGALEIRAGAIVAGSVVSTRGDPLDRVRLQLFGSAHRHRSGPMIEVPPATAESGIDGEFSWDAPIAAGTYRVVVQGAPSLVSGRQLRITEGQDSGTLSVVCAHSQAADELRGRVLDCTGRPAADVVVALASSPTGSGASTWTLPPPASPAGSTSPSVESRLPLVTRTREDGRFVFYRPESWSREQPVHASVSCFDGGEHQGQTEARWGDPYLTLALTTANRLRLTVVEAGGQTPVSSYAVRCFPMVGPRSAGDARFRTNGVHPGGIAWVEDLRPGRHLIVVHPRGAWASRFATTLPIEFDVPEGRTGELHVEVHPVQGLAVRVLSTEGEPMRGSTVEVFSRIGLDRVGPGTVLADLPTFFESRATRGPCAVRVGHARTDAEGVAWLDWVPSEEPLSVQVEGAHSTWRRDDFVFARGGQELAVQVTRGARLTGQLGPLTHLRHVHAVSPGESARLEFLRKYEGEAEAGRFWARVGGGLVLAEVVDGRLGARQLPWRRGHRYPIDAKGSFAIDGIPAGTWRVYLQRRSRTGVFEELALPLGEFRLEDGQTRSVRLDVRRVADPGTIDGTVEHNGEALADRTLRLTYVGRDGSRRVGATARTDTAGRFRMTELAPRAYRLEVDLSRFRLTLVDELTLAAGSRRTEALQLTTAAIELRLKRGSEVAGFTRVTLRGSDGSRVRRMTDQWGVLRLPFVRPGTYRIEGSDAEPIVVAAGVGEQRFTRDTGRR